MMKLRILAGSAAILSLTGLFILNFLFLRNKNFLMMGRRILPIFTRNKVAENFQEFAKMYHLQQLESARPRFHFISEPWKIKCKKKETSESTWSKWSSIVFVKSRAQNFGRRNNIRKTWGWRKTNNGVLSEIVFVIGNDGNWITQAFTIDEARNYGDVLHVNVGESYHELGMKTLAGMQWASENCADNWIYSSTDDDMIPNLSKLYQQIEIEIIKSSAEQYQNLLGIACGHKLQERSNNASDLSSKNYDARDQTYPHINTPTFCSGGFYSMPVNTTKALYLRSRSHPVNYFDDIWITGFIRIAVIASGGMPCHDVADESCGIVSKGNFSTSVIHTDNDDHKFIKIWRGDIDKQEKQKSQNEVKKQIEPQHKVIDRAKRVWMKFRGPLKFH